MQEGGWGGECCLGWRWVNHTSSCGGQRPQTSIRAFILEHTHTCADTEEGGGGLVADSVCGNLCINSIFPKALHWGSSSSCFHKDPQTCLILCLCRSVCVHISKFCNFVLLTRSPMNFWKSFCLFGLLEHFASFYQTSESSARMIWDISDLQIKDWGLFKCFWSGDSLTSLAVPLTKTSPLCESSRSSWSQNVCGIHSIREKRQRSLLSFSSDCLSALQTVFSFCVQHIQENFFFQSVIENLFFSSSQPTVLAGKWSNI